MQATLELIAHQGLGGVSMSAIAAAAGVARQTVYNHYSDVDSIVGAAFERHSAESLDSLNSLLAAIDSPAEKLDHLVRHTAAVAEHARGANALHHGLSKSAQLALEPYDAHLRAVIESILREGIAEGLFRQDLHPQRDAVLIQHLLDGVTSLVIAETDQIPSIVKTGIRTARSVAWRQSGSIERQ
ncbi:MAG: TetR family transcriptional regulator [Chloroflexi bacterium]|nr:TetR family transcriptional regulator [Chloroflexota bacterium]